MNPEEEMAGEIVFLLSDLFGVNFTQVKEVRITPRDIYADIYQLNEDGVKFIRDGKAAMVTRRPMMMSAAMIARTMRV